MRSTSANPRVPSLFNVDAFESHAKKDPKGLAPSATCSLCTHVVTHCGYWDDTDEKVSNSKMKFTRKSVGAKSKRTSNETVHRHYGSKELQAPSRRTALRVFLYMPFSH